jgi:hypothetical protein
VIHGEIQVVAWKKRDKKEQKQPDSVISLSEPKKEAKGTAEAIDIVGSAKQVMLPLS